MRILKGCRTYAIGKKALHFSCHSAITIKKRPEGRFFIRGHRGYRAINRAPTGFNLKTSVQATEFTESTEKSAVSCSFCTHPKGGSVSGSNYLVFLRDFCVLCGQQGF